MRENSANRAEVEKRRRLLDEWRAWRKATTEELGLVGDDVNGAMPSLGKRMENGAKGENGTETVEGIVEEIVDETEEVIGK